VYIGAALDAALLITTGGNELAVKLVPEGHCGFRKTLFGAMRSAGSARGELTRGMESCNLAKRQSHDSSIIDISAARKRRSVPISQQGYLSAKSAAYT
jgi:hypothetical protein